MKRSFLTTLQHEPVGQLFTHGSSQTITPHANDADTYTSPHHINAKKGLV